MATTKCRNAAHPHQVADNVGVVELLQQLHLCLQASQVFCELATAVASSLVDVHLSHI